MKFRIMSKPRGTQYPFRLVWFGGNPGSLPFMCTAIHAIISFFCLIVAPLLSLLFNGIPKAGWDANK